MHVEYEFKIYGVLPPFLHSSSCLIKDKDKFKRVCTFSGENRTDRQIHKRHQLNTILVKFRTTRQGLGSSVGIATFFGMGGPGGRIPVKARFSAPVQTGPGAHPASYTKGTVFFLGVKRPGRGVDQIPPSSADVKERVELYLYSPIRGLF